MSKINLRTERLNLRFVALSDLDAIHSLLSLPETDRYNTLGIPENMDVTTKILNDWIAEYGKATCMKYTFAIESNHSQDFIGLIALKLGSEKFKIAEVWYKLHSEHWGNGYATESLHALLNFGFEDLKLHRIEAGCAVENIASIRVLENVGLTREGRKRQVLPLKTGWSDNFEYAILETDARTIKKSSVS